MREAPDQVKPGESPVEWEGVRERVNGRVKIGPEASPPESPAAPFRHGRVSCPDWRRTGRGGVALSGMDSGSSSGSVGAVGSKSA